MVVTPLRGNKYKVNSTYCVVFTYKIQNRTGGCHISGLCLPVHGGGCYESEEKRRILG